MFISILALALAGEPTVDDVRARTRSLLESLCGARCDVVDVAIDTRPAVAKGSVAPGFDEPPEQRKVPSAIRLTLLFDARLEAAVRKFVSERIKHRIEELGLPVTIAERAIPFPALPVDEQPPRAAAAIEEPAGVQPSAAPIVINPPSSASPEPRLEPMGVMWLRLAESVPILLLALILAFVVMRLISRLEALSGSWPVDGEPEPLPTPRIASTATPAPAAGDLSLELRTHRPNTRRVVRSLIAKGEHDVVARAVAVLGDFLVRDLAHDPVSRAALPALGARTLEVMRDPIEPEARDEVLRRIRAELEADRISHLGEPRTPELDELLAYSPEAFVALAARLEERLRTVLLRHAPEHLVEAYMASVDEEARRDTVNDVFLGPAAEPREVRALAEQLRHHADAARIEGEETTRIVALLDLLPGSEQDAVASALPSRRPTLGSHAALPIESQLGRVDPNAIVAAWERLPLVDWIAYLRAAPEDLRARCLASCPERLRPVVAEELALAVPVDAERAAEARRSIVRVALDASSERPAQLPWSGV
ncbi:MAG: hypothetical protein HYV07_06335 [Deltaproteobacteria bacterium]|nr:hypothetical protein [Deltaproteobacteria bacterium]